MMNPYEKVLLTLLSKQNISIKVKFNKLQIKKIRKMHEFMCYNQLNHIRNIINRSELTDFECIEKIMSELDMVGLDCNRHDF